LAQGESPVSRRSLYLRLFVSGAISASLYFLLYLYEREIMQSFTRSDALYPALPVLAAFVFSFAHGAFTGYFWEALGVIARPRK
jgi:Na+-driven multidrug efflux pump